MEPWLWMLGAMCFIPFFGTGVYFNYQQKAWSRFTVDLVGLATWLFLGIFYLIKVL